MQTENPGHILPKKEMFACSAVKTNNIWIINLVPVSDWQEIKEMVISFPTLCHSFPWLTQVAKMNYFSGNVQRCLSLSLNVTRAKQ